MDQQFRQLGLFHPEYKQQRNNFNHDKLIIPNQRFNLRAKLCQRKSKVYTQILILLKLALIHVHLKIDAMAI